MQALYLMRDEMEARRAHGARGRQSEKRTLKKSKSQMEMGKIADFF
jgi:hypothetical protein